MEKVVKVREERGLKWLLYSVHVHGQWMHCVFHDHVVIPLDLIPTQQGFMEVRGNILCELVPPEQAQRPWYASLWMCAVLCTPQGQVAQSMNSVNHCFTDNYGQHNQLRGQRRVSIQFNPNAFHRFHESVGSCPGNIQVMLCRIMSICCMHLLIFQKVIPARYLDEKTVYHLQPSGSFVVGGPQVSTAQNSLAHSQVFSTEQL